MAKVPLFVPEIVSALIKQRQEHWCLRAIFTKMVQAVTMGHQETVQKLTTHSNANFVLTPNI